MILKADRAERGEAVYSLRVTQRELDLLCLLTGLGVPWHHETLGETALGMYETARPFARGSEMAYDIVGLSEQDFPVWAKRAVKEAA